MLDIRLLCGVECCSSSVFCWGHKYIVQFGAFDPVSEYGTGRLCI